MRAHEDLLLSMQSDTQAYYGQLTKARDYSSRAAVSAVRADSKETAASWQVNAALAGGGIGQRASARRGATVALATSPGRNVKLGAALALARIGDAARAKADRGTREELPNHYHGDALLAADHQRCHRNSIGAIHLKQ